VGNTSLEQLARCLEGEFLCEEQFGAAMLEVLPMPPVEAAAKRPVVQPFPPDALRSPSKSQGKVGAVVPPTRRAAVDETAIERERLQEEVRKAQQEAAEANKRADQAAQDVQKAQEERRQREALAADRELRLRRDAEEAAARQPAEASRQQEAAKRRQPPTVVVPSF